VFGTANWHAVRSALLATQVLGAQVLWRLDFPIHRTTHFLSTRVVFELFRDVFEELRDPTFLDPFWALARPQSPPQPKLFVSIRIDYLHVYIFFFPLLRSKRDPRYGVKVKLFET
jgi:hypothetical protein